MSETGLHQFFINGTEFAHSDAHDVSAGLENDMGAYFLVFLSAVAVDSIPIFAPPAWPILAFLLVYYGLSAPAVILLGVVGTTVGRVILSTYIPWIGHKLVNHWECDNLKFLGQRMTQSRVGAFVFVFLYSLTPLSTTALFTAAGMARAPLVRILPAFFLGKLVSYSVLILGAEYLANDPASIFHGAV